MGVCSRLSTGVGEVPARRMVDSAATATAFSFASQSFDAHKLDWLDRRGFARHARTRLKLLLRTCSTRQPCRSYRQTRPARERRTTFTCRSCHNCHSPSSCRDVLTRSTRYRRIASRAGHTVPRRNASHTPQHRGITLAIADERNKHRR